MRKNAKEVLDKPGPLDGITVVEYGLFHAGPGSGAILGDLGANVIKVEAGSGDPMRVWRRIGTKSYPQVNGNNPMFEFSNRNKECIYLDITQSDGRVIFEKLVKTADIFLTNLRKSTKSKLKIDYEAISSLNSNIIHASVSGFGKEGPAADDGGFDPLGQARSGMMHLTASEEPTLIQLAILDQATAITLSHAVMTALYTRERDGKGQEVHTSLYSTALWLMHGNIILNNFDIGVKDVQWIRSRNPPLRNCFKCRDGKWIVSTHHPIDKFWTAFCEATGQQQLLSDDRFKNEEMQTKHCAELVAHFDKVFATKDLEKWLKIFSEAGLMFSPIQDIEDVTDDLQATSNDYIVDFDHPDFGKMKVPGYPIKFSEYSAGIRGPSPGIGQHTDTILNKLGLDEPAIDALRQKGVVR